jgi:hypothetical protein
MNKEEIVKEAEEVVYDIAPKYFVKTKENE